MFSSGCIFGIHKQKHLKAGYPSKTHL